MVYDCSRPAKLRPLGSATLKFHTDIPYLFLFFVPLAKLVGRQLFTKCLMSWTTRIYLVAPALRSDNPMQFIMLRSAFVVIALLISLIGARAQRAVPDNHLAFPVLFTTASNFGSGFYLSTENAIYFVTARHVILDQSRGDLVAKSAQLLSHAADSKIDRDNFFILDLAEMQVHGLIKSNPTKDAVIIKLGAFTELLL